jgi:hypothetical protein
MFSDGNLESAYIDDGPSDFIIHFVTLVIIILLVQCAGGPNHYPLND